MLSALFASCAPGVAQDNANNSAGVAGQPASTFVPNSNLKLPPASTKAKLKPLSPEQISLIIGWIQQGAN